MFTAYLFEKSTVFIARFNYLEPENITWPVALWLKKIFLESRGIPLAGHPELPCQFQPFLHSLSLQFLFLII